MLYKYEIVSDGLVVRQGTYNGLTNPNQVARNAVERNRSLKINRYIINVINENGDVWMYSVIKKNDKKFIRKMASPEIILTQDDIDKIFSHNMTLRSLING